MMKYQQLTLEERLLISHLLRQGFNLSEIARQMGRHRSTISRELARNTCRGRATDIDIRGLIVKPSPGGDTPGAIGITPKRTSRSCAASCERITQRNKLSGSFVALNWWSDEWATGRSISTSGGIYLTRGS